MVAGLDAVLPGLSSASVGGALGLLSVGIWLIRLQRVAAYIRLGGLLLVLVAGVLVAGGATGVVRVDAGALARLVDAGARLLGNVGVLAAVPGPAGVQTTVHALAPALVGAVGPASAGRGARGRSRPRGRSRRCARAQAGRERSRPGRARARTRGGVCIMYERARGLVWPRARPLVGAGAVVGASAWALARTHLRGRAGSLAVVRGRGHWRSGALVAASPDVGATANTAADTFVHAGDRDAREGGS